MRHILVRFVPIACLAGLAISMLGQQYYPPIQQAAVAAAPAQQPPAQPATPAAQQPAPPAAAPAPQQPAAAPTATVTVQPPVPAPTPQPAATQLLSFDNVPLRELINLFGRLMKINFILDPRVDGKVTVHTYGEVRQFDYMPLLQTILRVNNATMVQVGDLYRIIPVNQISSLPLSPIVNPDASKLPTDESMVLSMIFLKYATAADMDHLLTPFYGEGATHSIYEPANMLIIQDNSRSMRRTLELIGMFDSDTFASQRVKLFDIANSRPSDLVKELDNVFKAYAMSDKNASVKFIPVDRINTLIAVAPNPNIFAEVQKWIEKLDIPVKAPTGAVSNWVYRLNYQRADMVAMAVMALYSGNPTALMALAQMNNQSMMAGGMGYNGSGYGMGMGGMGMYPGMGMGMGGYAGMGGYGNYANPYASMGGAPYSGAGVGGIAPAAPGAAGQTGQYLQGAAGAAMQMAGPHVIPNPMDNTILIQGTPQEYEQIKNLLRQLDVPPRQVLIEAKIFEVDLTGAFSAGVESFLQDVGTNSATGATGNGVSAGNSSQSVVGGVNAAQALAIAAGPGGVALTAGAMISRTRQLLGLLTMQESTGKSKVISSPSIIATDSIPATMNVGSEIPVATSAALVGGVQSGGNSVFANTISNQTTGVTLSITARVNASGVVTMMINQQVSAPQANTASSIDSPAFSNRSVSTQVTVQDGDTIAIGGAITESNSESSSGIPLLHRIPYLGLLFGTKSYNKSRSELIIFLTPKVIYDTNQMVDATEEIRNSLKRVGKMIKDDQ
jgi:general secretion pathway protein D